MDKEERKSRRKERAEYPREPRWDIVKRAIGYGFAILVALLAMQALGWFEPGVSSGGDIEACSPLFDCPIQDTELVDPCIVYYKDCYP